MVPKKQPAGEQYDREAVLVSIELVAKSLASQVAELQRFVALLRGPTDMNALAHFPIVVTGVAGNGKASDG